MQIPRVLVLGATGRIGGIVRRCWPQAPELGLDQVVWQARRVPESGPESGPETGPEAWAVFDPLADPEALARAAAGTSAILCLAGVVPGRGGNLEDNTALAEAAIRAGVEVGAKVLLTSSAAVYGNQAGMLDEDAPLVPVSAYGRAKADMEARAAALGRDLGGTVCALRIGNIAGIDAILGGWKPGFQLDRFADGRTPRRSYIGMRTLARVLGELVAADVLPGALPGALNVATPGVVEMGAVLDAAGLDWAPRPAPASTIGEVALSTQRLAGFVSLPETTPVGLVEEWRALTGTMMGAGA
jgi:nucleoside-diphosphate-sugar epimerase